jgi:hypothetical protein
MCFTRCLSFDDMGDAWANLASVHVQCDRIREARVCAVEACRKKPDDWRMWDNQAKICLSLNDLPSALLACDRMTNMNKLDSLGPLLSGAVMKVCEDVPMFESAKTCSSQRERAKQVVANVLAKRKHFRFFRLLAVLYETEGDPSSAAEKRLGETRALEQHLWEAPTEEFLEHLGQLKVNLEALKRLQSAIGDQHGLRMLLRSFPQKMRIRAAQCKLGEGGVADEVVQLCDELVEKAKVSCEAIAE